MSVSAKVGKTIGVIAVLAVIAVAAGVLIAWSLGNRTQVVPVIAGDVPLNADNPVGEPVPNAKPLSGGAGQPYISPQIGWTNTPEQMDTRPWDQKLDGILLGAGEASDKADSLLRLMKNPNTPPDAEVELSRHLINMAQDDHYDGVAGLLTNATTQTEVSTVLMNDLLNRRNTLKLPMLLAIARNDDHPLKDQAKDMLELFLQADYGSNWDQWSTAVDTWLQQNQ